MTWLHGNNYYQYVFETYRHVYTVHMSQRAECTIFIFNISKYFCGVFSRYIWKYYIPHHEHVHIHVLAYIRDVFKRIEFACLIQSKIVNIFYFLFRGTSVVTLIQTKKAHIVTTVIHVIGNPVMSVV